MSDIQREVGLESETVYEGRLIRVRKDAVRLPNGKTTTREVVVHPEAVVVLPVLEDGRLVLVRQYRVAIDRILLEVPAGVVDDGETPEAAGRREMVEETGYRVGTMEHITSFYSSPGFATELMHLYLASDLVAGQPTEETDQIEVELLSLDEAMQRMWNGEMPDAKTVAALALYGLRMRK